MFNPNTWKNFSKTVLLLLIAFFSIVGITKKWQNPLSWDAFGYHLYLPAAFLWNDVQLEDFSRVEKINAQYQCTGTFYQGAKTENGSWMIKYTVGLAMMEAPFFFAAHLLAPSLGYPADGFSRPYQLAFLAAHFVYLFIGLMFLRKVLLHFFSDKISGWLMLLLVFGTNFYVMALLTFGMTPVHILEFSILSAVLWLTISWHETPKIKTSVALGIALALATLVRPSDILFGLIPFLWNVNSMEALNDKLKTFFITYRLHTAMMMGVFLIVIFPQLLYWRITGGSWLLFSYSNNPGEGFDFAAPHIWDFLVSFRKGWLIYTPLMAIALAGFIQLYKRNNRIFWPVFVFFMLNLYVISSWSCWWYAGCFSQRAMVDSYALMLMPLGFVLTDIFNSQSKGYKKGLLALFGFLVALNLFQSWQYSQKIIDGSRMTSSYYFRVFGKTSASADDKKLLLIPRSTGEEEIFADEGDYTGKSIFKNDFNHPPVDATAQYNDTLAKEGKCIRLDSSFIYTAKMEKPYYDITRKDHAWIRTTFWYYPVHSAEAALLSLVVAFDHDGENYKYRATDAGKAISGQWNKVVVDYLTPEVRSKNDKVNIYLWLRGKGPVYVDDLQVEAYEQR